MPSAGLTAIVLAFGPDHYPAVVRALAAQGVPAQRIVVVQNPRSADEPVLTGVLDGVRVLRMARNDGYAAAMNHAMRAVTADGTSRFLLLTHDVDLPAGVVAALDSAAEAHPEAGVLGPVLRWRGAGGEIERVGWGGRVIRGRADQRDDAPDPVPELLDVDYVDGAAMLVTAEALRRTGGLDERFFLYYEETDFCRAVRAAGMRVVCVTAATLTQESGADRRPGAHAFLYTRNSLEFARRADGLAGVLSQAGWLVRWLPLRRLVRRSTPSAERAAARARLAGIAVGALAFVARRWGPPPRWLPGLGDVG